MSRLFSIILITAFILAGCNRNYTPKPRGYYRIDFPKKRYQKYDSICPYRFEFPVYAKILPDKEKNNEPCWINMVFPQFNAIIHISYIGLDNNLGKILEDTHTLAYKHAQMADGINNILIKIPEHHVFGILYDIKGNAASSKQFFLTDSTDNYLRGALYFNEKPNKDSLAPVIDFIAKDIDHFISSFEWK